MVPNSGISRVFGAVCRSGAHIGTVRFPTMAALQAGGSPYGELSTERTPKCGGFRRPMAQHRAILRCDRETISARTAFGCTPNGTSLRRMSSSRSLDQVLNSCRYLDCECSQRNRPSRPGCGGSSAVAKAAPARRNASLLRGHSSVPSGVFCFAS